MTEQKNNGEVKPADNDGGLSPNFRFKLIMGIIFLFFTVYFIYLLVRMVTG